MVGNRRFESALSAYATSAGPTQTHVESACIERIVRQFMPACVLERTTVVGPKQPQCLTFCVVVADRPDARMLWKVDGHTIKLFVSGVASLRKQLRHGGPEDLVRSLSGARFVHGDRRLADELQASARETLRSAPPAPTGERLFDMRSLPFDLLREFEGQRTRDLIGAGLVLARLIITSVDAYCARNRIWAHACSDGPSVIRTHDARVAEMLERVMIAPLSSTCADPSALEELICALAGRESFDHEMSL